MNVSHSITTVFCISRAVRILMFSSSIVLFIPLTIFPKPPPQQPITNGTISTKCPFLLSRISKASCLYFVSFPLFFSQYYFPWGMPYRITIFSSFFYFPPPDLAFYSHFLSLLEIGSPIKSSIHRFPVSCFLPI